MKKSILIFILFFIQITAKADLMSSTLGFVQFKSPETKEPLKNKTNKEDFFCGGVKISKLQYLTASHCTDEIAHNFGKIKSGAYFYFDNVKVLVNSVRYPKNTLEIAKKEVKCFEDEGCFIPTQNPKWIDIAIIEVSEENELPIAQINPHVELTTKIVVSGSELVDGVFEKSAIEVDLVKTDQFSGRAWLNPSNGIIVNPGDSGSPVWSVSKNGKIELIGITSGSVVFPTVMTFNFITNVFNELGIH